MTESELNFTLEDLNNQAEINEKTKYLRERRGETPEIPRNLVKSQEELEGMIKIFSVSQNRISRIERLNQKNKKKPYTKKKSLEIENFNKYLKSKLGERTFGKDDGKKTKFDFEDPQINNLTSIEKHYVNHVFFDFSDWNTDYIELIPEEVYGKNNNSRNSQLSRLSSSESLSNKDNTFKNNKDFEDLYFEESNQIEHHNQNCNELCICSIKSNKIFSFSEIEENNS